MKVSFLIVNWNGGEIFKKCIESIEREISSLGQEIEAEIIVVDNNSSDLDEQWIIGNDNIKLYKNEKNVFFSKGTNQSVHYSSGDILVLLNNDIKLRKGVLKLAITELMGNEIDLVVPRLYYPDARNQNSIRGFPTLSNIYFASTFINKINKVFDTWYLTDFNYEQKQLVDVQPMFSALFMKRKTWELVGDLDEDFPLLFNDVDWFYRFNKLGRKCLYLPTAKVTHVHAMSLNKKPFNKIYESTISMKKYFIKHHSFGIIKTIMANFLYLYTFILRLISSYMKIFFQKYRENTLHIR